jgi:hypothetical protein
MESVKGFFLKLRSLFTRMLCRTVEVVKPVLESKAGELATEVGELISEVTDVPGVCEASVNILPQLQVRDVEKLESSKLPVINTSLVGPLD